MDRNSVAGGRGKSAERRGRRRSVRQADCRREEENGGRADRAAKQKGTRPLDVKYPLQGRNAEPGHPGLSRAGCPARRRRFPGLLRAIAAADALSWGPPAASRVVDPQSGFDDR